MSYTVTLCNDQSVVDLLGLLEHAPVRAASAIVRGVAEGSQIILGLAIRERFSGQGPYPVAQKKLGVQTGTLRRSLEFTRPTTTGDGVVRTAAFSPVKYWAAHEFGFRGQVSVRASKTLKSGAQRKAHTRRANIPKRAPLTTAIEEHSTRVYTIEIAKQLTKEINNV